MENNIETSRALATRIYDLDSEVYRLVGSSLGRTFTGDKETSIRNLTTLISTHPQGHLLRSEIALIGNMARTIRNNDDHCRSARDRECQRNKRNGLFLKMCCKTSGKRIFYGAFRSSCNGCGDKRLW